MWATFSPRCVKMVPIPSCSCARAAASASSSRSPGMNADTERRTNVVFVAWSRSHALVDAASSSRRAIDTFEEGPPEGGPYGGPCGGLLHAERQQHVAARGAGADRVARADVDHAIDNDGTRDGDLAALAGDLVDGLDR